MKKFFIASIAASLPLLAATGTQAAPTTLVNEDGSTLSELCIMAVHAEGSIYKVAKDLGISPFELDRVACNGKPLVSFVRSQRKLMHEKSTGNYSFNRGDNSMETQLCIAAVTEPEKYAELKPEYVAKTGTFVGKVRCNSQPLNIFVKRYGSAALSSL